MVRSAVLGGLLLAVVAGAGARAQPAAPLPGVTQLPGVTVVAPPIKDVPALVQKFSQPVGDHRLARWEAAVCPSVRGMPAEYDRFVERRIKQIVVSVGGMAGGPRCRVDLAILVVPDAQDVAKAIAGRHRGVLEETTRWPIDKSKLAAFVDGRNPVRVWRATDEVQSTGGFADQGDVPAQAAALLTLSNSLFAPREYSNGFASRLTPFSDVAFTRVLVIVDGKQAGGLTAGQLSAYVAMVSLAQIRPDTDLDGVSSIMTLFADRAAGRPPPRDLSFWDRAYLQSLYRTDGQINAELQLSYMSDHIKREIAAHDVLTLSATQAGAK
ncbi:MAG: hypothetical protein WA840_00095 [Caulobacteraceae bacterium]